MNYDQQYSAYVGLIDKALEQAVPPESQAFAHGAMPARLSEAMRYSLLAPGKRLRPVLLLACVEMLGGNLDEALPYGAAIEMIHAYSLVHDDLPGMDDDDLRRGRPTNHKVFGEGIAILAGDALHSRAYEWMLASALGWPAHGQRHLAAAEEIARRAGTPGMIGGQCMDLLSEGALPDVQTLAYIHQHKTADLLTAPLVAGARLCGATEDQVAQLNAFGSALGLAFQIADDILDVQGDPAQMGKAAHMDQARGKLTWPSLKGVEASRADLARLLDQAGQALVPFGESAAFLRALLERQRDRNA